MNTLQLFSDGSNLKKEEIEQKKEKILQTIKQIERTIKEKEWSSPYAEVLLPLEKKKILEIQKVARNYKDVSLVILIAIGGSNLGTIAVYEALRGKLANLINIPRMLYADTVDPDYLEKIIKEIEKEQQAKRRVLLICISKSGTTTETIANTAILFQKVKEILVITDENSPLWKLSKKENYLCFPIPKNVGGRYSILSNVGLLPLAIAGINIEQLIKGAADIQKQCLLPKIEKNPAATSALILNYYAEREKKIHNTFLFSNDLEAFGKWYRQLTAESLGKEKDKSGNIIHAGITPTVAIGSTDLHSMAQLYLGGPDDKVTTFIGIKKTHTDYTIQKNSFTTIEPLLEKKSLHQILQSIQQGIQTTYKKKKIPFIEISLPEKSEYVIGQLLQMKMLEVMFLGSLMNINAFDQPSVEEYKQETKKILKHGKL